MAENVQDPKAEESVKPEVKPKSEKSKSSEKVKPEESKVEEVPEVVTEHFHHHHHEHVRRQKLYDDYWKDKVKDPTDNRHPSEYTQGWWYPHG